MLKTLIPLGLAIVLGACGGGGGNSGTGPLHKDPYLAGRQIDLAQDRTAKDAALREKELAYRQEVEVARLVMQREAAAARAALDRDTAVLKEETTRVVSKTRTDAATSVAFLAAILLASCYWLKAGLNHRGEEIAFRTQAQQNMAAIDGLLKQLPSLPEDIQRAVLLNLTDKALGKPTSDDKGDKA